MLLEESIGLLVRVDIDGYKVGWLCLEMTEVVGGVVVGGLVCVVVAEGVIGAGGMVFVESWFLLGWLVLDGWGG